ncbi:MAG: 50S ribosomal protein L6 [Vampirovibrio sp.]|nr:50S ribosomal protein L6 [Vampirovibrio sp.]
MSRIGKAPIDVPDKVEISLDGNTVTVKGPLGTLTRTFRPEVTIRQDGNVLHVERQNDQRQSRSLHGLSRTLLANMVNGVSQGFKKELKMVGVGYRAQVQGQTLVMQLGYSHPVEINPPEGVKISVEGNVNIAVEGADKETVGQVAALIRSKRAPEPYKGKGVMYTTEKIRRKAGKAGKK